MGFVIAIVGPDGAGKTTVCRELAETLPFPTQYVYMGINLEVSNVLLPTTRLWLEMKRWRGKRPDMGRGNETKKPESGNGVRRWLRHAKSNLRLANLMCEEAFRQMVCRYWRMRGRTVICDRDFYCDYYAYDVAPQKEDRDFGRRIHGWFLSRVYRRPDLLIVLEAAAEQMHGRKGEGTIEDLEKRRLEYRQLESQFSNFYVVDSTPSLDIVVQQAGGIVENFVRPRPSLAGGTS